METHTMINHHRIYAVMEKMVILKMFETKLEQKRKERKLQVILMIMIMITTQNVYCLVNKKKNMVITFIMVFFGSFFLCN